MERRIDYVDVPSCMLFESIGDSEADSDVNRNDNIGGLSSDLAEDDAYSCCSENHEYYHNDVDHHHDVYVDEDQLKEEVEEQSGDSNHEYDEDEDEDEDDAVVQVVNYVNCKSEEAGPRTNKPKVRGGVNELLNEKDMDRHFWETCLAS